MPAGHSLVTFGMGPLGGGGCPRSWSRRGADGAEGVVGRVDLGPSGGLGGRLVRRVQDIGAGHTSARPVGQGGTQVRNE